MWPMSMVQDEEDLQIPVPELLDALLEHGASDLHLTAGAPPTIRVHGDLMKLERLGIAGVLVSTALHEGTLQPTQNK